MFLLLFGTIWTIQTTIIFVLGIFKPAEGFKMSFGLFLFFLLFEAIGILLIYLGVKEIITNTKETIKNKKTNEKGTVIFGRIIDFTEGPSATILAYIPDEKCAKTFSEILGFSYKKIQRGAFVLLRYFENDISIIQEIPESSVSPVALEKLKEKTKYFDLDDSSKKEINDFYWRRMN